MRIGSIARASLLFTLAGLSPAAEPVSPKAADLSLSASAEISRSHQTRLNDAQENLNAGRYAEGIQNLQKVLDGEEAFVSRGQLIENSHAAARRLLEALPPAWRDRYDEQFGEAARMKLHAAKTKNDPQAIRRVFEQYPLTQAGFEALRLSAIRHLDHGEFLPAAAGFQAISEHPFTSSAKSMQRADVERWTISLSRLGLSDQAQQVAARYRKERKFSDRTISADGGKKATSLPSSQVMWQQSFPLPEAAEKLLDSMKKELHHRGFLLPANFSPIVAGDLVIGRSLSEVTAFDRNTGEVRWRKPTKTQLLDLTEQGLMAHPQFRQILGWQLAAASLANRNTGTLCSDGSRVFLVLSDEAPDRVGNWSPGGLKNDFLAHGSEHRQSYSQLLALDAKTGNELWKRPAELPNRDPALRFSGWIPPGIFFFGPPVPLGDSLYAVGQKEREIRLYVLQANTGEIEWLLPLAMAEVPLIKDPMRRRLACPVAFAGGLLLCPTGAGAVAAVDPQSRSVRWVSRYFRDDLPEPPAEVWPAGNTEQPAADSWWSGWRDASILLRRETVVFTSPESDRLHAISLRTGEPLWTLARGDGLFLAETAIGPVLVIGSKAVRLVNPADGRVLWTAPVPRPAGRGIVRSNENGSTYLLPLEAGGVLEIDPVQKTARRTFPLRSEAWGNLITNGDMIFMQTHDRLVRLAPLKTETAPPR